MMVTIKLFRSSHVGFDLDTKRPVFQSATAAALFMASPGHSWATNNWNKIGDPIIVPLDYNTAKQYDIGLIQTRDNPQLAPYDVVWFRVRDVFVNETNRTELAYDIDYLQMYMYNMKAGHIDRLPAGHPYALPKTITPRYWEYTASTPLTSSLRVVFILKQMKSSRSNTDYDIAGPVYNVLEGQWFYLGQDNKIHGINLIDEASRTSGRFALTDVVNAWLIPSVGTLDDDNLHHWEDVSTSSTHISGWKMVNSTGMAWWNASARLSGVPASMISAEVQGGLLQTSDTAAGRLMGVCDERGTIVWTFPDRKVYGLEVDYSFKMSMASCEVDIAFKGPYGGGGSLEPHLQNDMFTYSARPIDVIGDSWQDYLFRQRDADIQNRKLQNQANLVGGMANAGSGALMGAAMGSVVPGIGTAAGAIAGGITSIVGSAVNYGVQSYYGDKMQRVTDQAYKVAQDTVAVNGMITSSAMAFGIVLYLFRIDADGTSMSLIEKSNAVEGVPADAFSEDMFADLCDACDIGGDGFVPFGGTCEIDATVPSSWKKTASAQLAAGARYKKFGTWT